MVALHPFAERERAGTDQFGARLGTFGGVFVQDVEVLEEIEGAGSRFVRLEHDRVLVGRFDARKPGALSRERTDKTG
jgi:hypothetical protein